MYPAENTTVKYKAYSKGELRSMYGVSWKTIKLWIKTVPNLGEYLGGSYTPAQVEKIFNHLGNP